MEIVRSELGPNVNTSKALLPKGAMPGRHVSISQDRPLSFKITLKFEIVWEMEIVRSVRRAHRRQELGPNAHTNKALLPKGAMPGRHVSISQVRPLLT